MQPGVMGPADSSCADVSCRVLNANCIDLAQKIIRRNYSKRKKKVISQIEDLKTIGMKAGLQIFFFKQKHRQILNKTSMHGNQIKKN